MTEFASAFVTIVPSMRGARQQIERELGDAGDSAGRESGEQYEKSFKSATKKVGAGLLAAGAAAGGVALLKGAIDAAADFGETVSKSRNIFGQASADVEEFASTSAKAFGISKTAAVGAAAGYGDLFTQLGFTQAKAAELSTGLIKTAADLGSFNNVDPTDVLDRISASLRGEFDSLQALIPGINGTRVEMEALAATGKSSAAALTAQEKVTATLAIISKDGARAMDDFSETSGGLANQQRILAARFEDAKVAVGEKLLPAAVALTTIFAQNVGPVIGTTVGLFKDLGQGAIAVAGFIDDNRTTFIVAAAAVAGLYVPALIGAVTAQAALLKASVLTMINKIGIAAATTAGGLNKMKIAAAGATAGLAIIAAFAVKDIMSTKQAANDARDAIKEIGEQPINVASVVGVRERIKDLELGVQGYIDKLKDGNASIKELSQASAAYKEQQKQVEALNVKAETYNRTVDSLARGLGLTREEVIRLGSAAEINDLLTAGKYSEASIAIAKVKNETKVAATNTQILGDKTKLFAAAAKKAEEDTERFTTAIDKLFGKTIGIKEAQIAFEAQLDALTVSFKENGRSLDINSEKGRANQTALIALSTALFDNLTALEAQKVGSARLSEEFDKGVTRFEKTAKAAGLTKKQVEALKTQLNLTPSTKKILISQSGGEAVRVKAKQIADQLKAIENKRIFVTVVVNGLQTAQGIATKLGNLPGDQNIRTQPKLTAATTAKPSGFTASSGAAAAGNLSGGRSYFEGATVYIQGDKDIERKVAAATRLVNLTGGY